MPMRLKLFAVLALALLFLSAPGLAEPAQPERLTVQTQDTPPGHPYNVGRAAYDQVPLRDYLSSRIDSLRSELIDRMNERDVRYAQRFAAQQEAVQAALQAAKEAVANALSAAKEAVLKAEDASKDKFAGVNELRGSLNDVIRLQLPRLEGEARFNATEQKLSALEKRLDAITNSNQGADETWVLIGSGVFFLLAIGTFVLNARRDQGITKRVR